MLNVTLELVRTSNLKLNNGNEKNKTFFTLNHIWVHTLNDTIYYEIIYTSLCFEDMYVYTNGIAGNMVYNK